MPSFSRRLSTLVLGIATSLLLAGSSVSQAEFQVNVSANVNYPTHARPADQSGESAEHAPGPVTSKTSAKSSASVKAGDQVVASAKGRAEVTPDGKVHLGIQAVTEHSPRNYATAQAYIHWYDRLFLDFGPGDATKVRFEIKLDGTLSGAGASINLEEGRNNAGGFGVGLVNTGGPRQPGVSPPWHGELAISNFHGNATEFPAKSYTEQSPGGFGPYSFTTPVHFDIPIQVDNKSGRLYVDFSFLFSGRGSNFDFWGNQFGGGKVEFYNSAILEAITLPEFGGATPESQGYALSFESGIASPNRSSPLRTPEPTALLLLAMGGGGLLARRFLARRREPDTSEG